jgi:hypothetical protein
MKIMKIKDSMTNQGKNVDFQDLQLEITERVGQMHLLIVAIDLAMPMGIKSATFHFPNREEGLQTFNILEATAQNALKTCVEDARPMASGVNCG